MIASRTVVDLLSLNTTAHHHQHPTEPNHQAKSILARDPSPPLDRAPNFVPCLFRRGPMTYINARDPRVATPNLTPTEPLVFTGGCYCKKLTYNIRVISRDEVRTTICHCKSCKKTFGSAFAATVKVPITGVRMTGGSVVVRYPCRSG